MSSGVVVTPGNVPVYHGCNLKVIDRRMRVVEVILRCAICVLGVLAAVLVGIDKQDKVIFSMDKKAKFTDMKALVMSSSNTIRSESTPKCRCGAGDMKLYTSRTQLNPNRKFWKCPNWNNENGCGAFLWKDEVANWQQSEANSSTYERENRRDENSNLITVVEKLERSLRVLIEVENIRIVYLQKIYHAIIVTWCIIILVVMFR